MARKGPPIMSPDTPKRKGPPPIDERIAPVLTPIIADVPIPEVASRPRRGIKSVYPFDQLDIGQSFGVSNKTLKQIASVVSAQNRKHLVQKLDDQGRPLTRPITAKTADGHTVTTAGTKPVMVASKRFYAAEVDPKRDPAKATIRVWRVAVDAT